MTNLSRIGTDMKIEQEYLYATDCQLATLDQMAERKRTSKSDVSRQRGICRKMLQVCQEIDPVIVQPARYTATGPHWGRVNKILEAARKEPEGLVGALDRYIAEARGAYA